MGSDTLHYYYVSGTDEANGRMYDPVLGRFLSPDPFIQSPTDPQNYNRYSYCLNNPLKYTDPSGEILWETVLFSAIISANLNVALQGACGNIDTYLDVFNYYTIGFVSGASGVLVEGAVACKLGTSGIAAGAISSSSAAFTSNFIIGAGNLWASGSNFSDGIVSGLKVGLIGAALGGILGGLSGGLYAYKNGGNIWSGEGTILHDEIIEELTSNKVVIGDGMTYSNEYAQTFSCNNFDDMSDWVDNLYANGSLPKDYTCDGDIVYNRSGVATRGSIVSSGIGKKSSIYLFNLLLLLKSNCI